MFEGKIGGLSRPQALTAERVAREYGARLHSLALRILGHRHDAEDVVQDVLVIVVRSLHSFRGDAAVSTWLHTLTVHAAHAYRRRRGPTAVSTADSDALIGVSPVPGCRDRCSPADPEDLALDREAGGHLRQAVAGLPQVYRDAIVLADLGGLTHAEVADQLGINPLTVRTRTHRARALLREALAPYFERGDTRTSNESHPGLRVDIPGATWPGAAQRRS